ncbi:MAG: zinc metalloprotease HtpX [Aquificaceae bacterium]|nr:zinc metalloprotease HtpX [Aquificaceae bacterium]MDW8237669.1 zinc metalloprotease HtpX [Aquificaceae bacterium]
MAIRSALLLGLLTGIFLAIGGLVGGKFGMFLALILAGVMNFIAYFFSDKIVLSMSGAKPISPEQAPALYNMVRELSQRANIPMPRLYLIPSEQPNAFATGRGPSNGVVAVTSGLLNLLNEREVRGVIAHEIAHIKNRDVLVSTIAATIAGAIGYLMNFLQFSMFFRSEDEESPNPLSIISSILMIIIVPIIATLIQLAISRSREYLADEVGAQISADPMALASALEKIENYVHQIPEHVNPGTAHMYIANPLSSGGIMELLSTHPSTQKRIERLYRLKITPGVF